MFVSRHRVSMCDEKKLRIDEGVMLLESKKSINKPHLLFKLVKTKVATYTIVWKQQYFNFAVHNLESGFSLHNYYTNYIILGNSRYVTSQLYTKVWNL